MSATTRGARALGTLLATLLLTAGVAHAQPGAAAAGSAAPGPAPILPVPATPQVTIKWDIHIAPPRADNGAHLDITWTRTTDIASNLPTTAVLVLRRAARATDVGAQVGAQAVSVNADQGSILPAAFLYATGAGPERIDIDTRTAPVEAGRVLGDWTVVGVVDAGDTAGGSISDEPGVDTRVVYALLPTKRGPTPGTLDGFVGNGVVTRASVSAGAWFAWDRWFLLALVLATGLAFAAYVVIAKRHAGDLFVRRIAGVDAIEDAIGRSTEMGRPVLYVTGVEEIQDIQTIASLLILGHVAEMTATYDTELKVANAYPMTMIVAEEIVRQGYTNAGRPDAHKSDNVLFITSEQFAFAAAVNGMILRDRPAANIYLGRFFAESLILAETGFLTGAVQIAGTAEFTQLPFFIAACDHTLIGEELFATSAYLSRDPVQLAQLKAGDVMKVVIFVLVMVGVIGGTFWHYDLMGKLLP